MLVDFKELSVWKEAHDFAHQIYDAVNLFPSSEKFALSSQLKRATISIFSNIAEGTGRSTYKNYCSFLYIARGSNKEVESYLYFAYQRKYLDELTYNKLISINIQIGKMLTNLIKSMELKIT